MLLLLLVIQPIVLRLISICPTWFFLRSRPAACVLKWKFHPRVFTQVFFLRWEHALQNGWEAEVSRWRSSQWTCHLKILRAGPEDRVHICKHNTFSTLNPAPHPQHGSPKMWATVSGIIAPPCFHNVWWKSDAISKSSGVCWVSCSSVYCLK